MSLFSKVSAFFTIYLFLFAGVMKTVAISVLVESIVIVIVLPFILAQMGRSSTCKIKFTGKIAVESATLPFAISVKIKYLVS
jgi:ACR3 family arsenite transporter